jgi:4-hydroxy-3-methylbut-2-enyl diphosphate reductase
MVLKVKKASGIGFCFGVKRAIDILEKFASQHGQIETLGAVVHNRQVMNKLAEIGITVADSLGEVKGKTVALGAHGVSPQVEEEIRSRNLEIINCTCSFVHRAQVAAQQLAQSGFFVVVYGDADHPEVKGIIGWAGGKGIATLDIKPIIDLKPLPRRLGVLSQTTQIPTNFTDFTKKVIDIALAKDAEIRIIDTICHDIRERQQAALELANQVDIMIVIGSRTSANTNHLTELCATVTRTELIETAEDIKSSWFQGDENVGVTSGASTSEETINEVLSRLEIIA